MDKPWNFRRPLILNAVVTTPISLFIGWAVHDSPDWLISSPMQAIIPIGMWLFGFAFCVLLENSSKI